MRPHIFGSFHDLGLSPGKVVELRGRLGVLAADRVVL